MQNPCHNSCNYSTSTQTSLSRKPPIIFVSPLSCQHAWKHVAWTCLSDTKQGQAGHIAATRPLKSISTHEATRRCNMSSLHYLVCANGANLSLIHVPLCVGSLIRTHFL